MNARVAPPLAPLLGRRLLLARVAWVVVAVTALAVLINRTIVYATLSATLAGAYFGGFVLLQRIFAGLTGREKLPQLAIVTSTLVVAALFDPLRRRIQTFIDRRFYRNKYDATKTIERFSAKLRDETDLDALSEDLVGVVSETVQPTHVSLWLRLRGGPNPGMKEWTG